MENHSCYSSHESSSALSVLVHTFLSTAYLTYEIKHVVAHLRNCALAKILMTHSTLVRLLSCHSESQSFLKGSRHGAIQLMVSLALQDELKHDV